MVQQRWLATFLPCLGRNYQATAHVQARRDACVVTLQPMEIQCIT